MSKASGQHVGTRVLVMAPYMHKPGHTATFPRDIALGFASTGADVTLAYPFPSGYLGGGLSGTVRFLPLESEIQGLPKLARSLWARLKSRPLLCCLVWLVLGTRGREYDLVFWTDTEAASKRSVWYLQLGRILRPTRAVTAFAEHYPYPWSANRLGRQFRIDRLRLLGIDMFSFSRALLETNRGVMNWPSAGYYLPWGLWPKPATESSRRQARHRLDLPDDARVLLVFGVLSIRRKEIDTLAEVLKSIDLQQPLIVLFAGKRACDAPHPFDDTDLQSKHNLRVRRVESFIPDTDVPIYFAAADAIWAYYGGFTGASGVLLQSIGYGRLVIASDAAEIGELSRQHRLGLIAAAQDLRDLQTAVEGFVGMPVTVQREFESNATAAAEYLSWPQIAAGILQVAREHS